MNRFDFDSGLWLSVMLEVFWKSGLVLLAACLLTCCLRNRSAAQRFFVWLLALCGLGWIFFAAASIEKETLHSWTNVAPALVRSTVATTSAPFEAEESAVAEWDYSRVGIGLPHSISVATGSFVQGLQQSSWAKWILVIWCVGFLVFLSALLLGLSRVRQLRKRATIPSEELLHRLNAVCQRLGIKRQVRFILSSEELMPMTWGIKRPTIIVPATFGDWSVERQEAVLLHELAHIKRADCFFQLIAWGICSIYWFNPLVWFALRKFYSERERACDDLVLSRGTKATDYASHLLDIAREFRRRHSLAAAAVAMARPSEFEGRLLSILDSERDHGTTNGKFAWIAAFVAGGLVVVLSGCKTPYLVGKTRSILFGKGDVELVTGHNPSDIARGDLDGDGRPDLAVVNYYDDTLSIFRNIGTRGEIAYAEKFDLPQGKTPISVEIRDVDGDGKKDIIVANHYGESVWVYRNICDGILSAASFAPPYQIETEKGPSNAIVRDLNGDGKPDLIVANNGHAKGNNISIFENTSVSGEISFGPLINLPVGTQPTFLAVADLDGDLRPDIAVVNNLDFTLTFLRNRSGTGELNQEFFSRGTEFKVGEGQIKPYRIAISDLDKDGRPDVLVGTATHIAIYRNTSLPGKFSFAPEVQIETATDTAVSLTVGDLNADGKPDFAVGHLGTNLVTVFYNSSIPGQLTAKSFENRSNLLANEGASGVVISDLDGDGKPDLAVANERASTISVFRNLAQKR
ncbi:MAG: FG-GAP-like repeat-containing protein [Limisphaerales bacterium]